MHKISFDLSLDDISKIEGNAAVNVTVRDGKVSDLRFQVTGYRRFYTQAVQGKPIAAVPQHLARICGTCSNAHLLCSIQSIEHALKVVPSEQTKLLRRLVVDGLMIRDHALHLYVFSLPDLFEKDSLLDFDEQDKTQHQLLHDTFDVKSIGNDLSNAFGGRSVHAIYPTIGGFLQIPSTQDTQSLLPKLANIREAVLRLIDVFAACAFHQEDRDTIFFALDAKDQYSFLEGNLATSDGTIVPATEFRKHLERVVIPYSQASGFSFIGKRPMVGALARMNLHAHSLHPKTKESVKNLLNKFPSSNIFDNNLAQAIEILHCVDEAYDILNSHSFHLETPIKPEILDGIGIGVVEAPRGTLYHQVTVEKAKVTASEVIVPTGQNQISIEQNLKNCVEQHIDMEKKKLELEMEKVVRAYDPCMSCATHFLKVKWK